MSTEQTISIQKAIGMGQDFWTWWRNQEFFPQNAMYSKDIALIHFDQQTAALATNLKRFKQLIVVNERGIPPEHFSFVIHQSPDDATKHGRLTLGKGRFRIITFSQFKLSPTFRIMQRRIANKNRHTRYKNANIPQRPSN